MIVLVTGGSGSGKSAFAERLTASLSAENRVYIATMQVGDEESVRRVERHRAQRADKGFVTIECPKDLSSIDVPADSAVLLEDLPNLCANEMFDSGDPDRILPALTQLAGRCRHLVIVTGDVFSDGGNHDPDTQAYLRTLADLGRHAAQISDCAIEVVFSIPVVLKGALLCGSFIH